MSFGVFLHLIDFACVCLRVGKMVKISLGCTVAQRKIGEKASSGSR